MTINDKRTKKLVVIGDCSSLTHQILLKLTSVCTLGMDASFRHWEVLGWYPDVYCCIDEELISRHWREIKRLIDNRLVQFAFLSSHFVQLVPESKDDARYCFLDSFVSQLYEHRGRRQGLHFVQKPEFACTLPEDLTTVACAVRYGVMSGFKHIALMNVDLAQASDLSEDSTPDLVKSNDFNALEALRNNGMKLNWNVEIINATLRSALNDLCLFPYQSIEKFLGVARLGAVVVPTMASEREAILNNLWLWDQPAYAPFLHFINREPPKLVFYFNNESARSLEGQIAEAFKSTENLKHQFSQVECRFLSLHGESDLYLRSGSRAVGEQGYKAGPNNQFFEIITNASDFGEYIFYMETDCVPIRPDWLGQLQDLVQNAEPFWVMGSIYRGQSVLERLLSRHINGNAIYAVGSPSFQAFVASVWRPVLKGIAARLPRCAYDEVVETIFNGAQSNRLEDSVWRLMQSVFHKWRYTDFIQNHSGPNDSQRMVDELMREVLTQSPTTHLLHGQVFVGTQRQMKKFGIANPCEFKSSQAPIPGKRVAPLHPEPDRSYDWAAKEFLAGYLKGRTEYDQLVDAICDEVNSLLPPAAKVAVVSKGDENLLKLGDRLAWHFPNGENGSYAGYYPADDDAAIEHLKRLRSKGADFLVVPKFSFWWLTKYAGFGEHLFATFRAQVLPKKTAVIFHLKECNWEALEQFAARCEFQIKDGDDI